jgi:hypothetical protein
LFGLRLKPPLGRLTTIIDPGLRPDRSRQVFYHDEDGHEPLETVVCLEVEKRKKAADPN